MRRWVLYISLLFLFPSSAFTQFYYFGRNKVQYTDFRWQILRTEHFEIYYYPEMEELAHQGAALAEESFTSLEVKFNHTILYRIPLIFYSSHLHFQQTNTTPGFIPEGVGGFFEFMKGRVVIPSDGSIPRFRHVIRHELVHVFMHSKLNRVLVDHRQPADRTAPLWFVEGLAEFWSTEWDDQAEMLIRDAVLHNYIVPLADIEQIYGSFLMYKEGQNIVEYIDKKFGEEKVLLLMENFWRSNSFSEIMQFTLGKNYKEFDEEWLYTLKKRYYPVLQGSEYASRASRVVVKDGFNTKPVYWNNGGKREIFFIGNYTGYTSIYKIDLDEKEKDAEPKVVLTGEQTDAFEAFHPFQSKLTISKKGILAFVTKHGETDVIHLYDVTGQTLVKTLQFNDLVVLSSPHWSPDGARLVFSSIDKSGKMDLYLYTIESELLVRITDDCFDDRDASWSPDGRWIIFSSDRLRFNRTGHYGLYTYDTLTGTIGCLAAGAENYYSPSFSPDGTYILCTSTIDGTQNVWAIQSPFSGEVQSPGRMKKITSFSNAVFDPQWTDRDEIIFTGFENYSFKIFSLPNATAAMETLAVTSELSPLYRGRTWVPQTLEGDTTMRSLPYAGEYSLDIAQSQVSTDPIFGTGGGAAVALSDMLGNDQYYFLLYNNAQTTDEFLESFNIAVSRISLGQRTNYATGVFHFSGRRYDLTDPDLFYYERAFGGYFVLSYPLSKFRRIEAGISLSNSDKEIIYGFRPRKALLIGNTVSFVHDNSLWGPTGPLDGSRLLATLAYTTDVQYSNVSYYTLIGDYRHYFRLTQRSAIASRVMAIYNDGREARRYFMGGSWDLRGYPRWSLRGKKIWLTSTELRFPFVDQVGVRFPFGGLSLGAVRGALFFDAGNAWDNDYTETLGSTGVGIRFNIAGILVLRYDIGKQIINNFSGIQRGLFYQFFFGWDF